MAVKTETAKVKRDPRAKFVELANKRGNRVISAIETLGNLSNPSSYTYSPEDVTALMGAVAEALQACEARFNQPVRTKTADRTLVK